MNAQAGWLLTDRHGRYYLAPDHVFYMPTYSQGFFFNVSGGAWDGDPLRGQVRLVGFEFQIFSDVIVEAEEPRSDSARLFGYQRVSTLHYSPAPPEVVPRPDVSLAEMSGWRGERLPKGWAVDSWEDASTYGRLIVGEAHRLNRADFAETLAEVQALLG